MCVAALNLIPCDSTWVERMVTQWNTGETVREYSRSKKVLVFNG